MLQDSRGGGAQALESGGGQWDFGSPIIFQEWRISAVWELGLRVMKKQYVVTMTIQGCIGIIGIHGGWGNGKEHGNNNLGFRLWGDS